MRLWCWARHLFALRSVSHAGAELVKVSEQRGDRITALQHNQMFVQSRGWTEERGGSETAGGF